MQTHTATNNKYIPYKANTASLQLMKHPRNVKIDKVTKNIGRIVQSRRDSEESRGPNHALFMVRTINYTVLNNTVYIFDLPYDF